MKFWQFYRGPGDSAKASYEDFPSGLGSMVRIYGCRAWGNKNTADNARHRVNQYKRNNGGWRVLPQLETSKEATSKEALMNNIFKIIVIAGSMFALSGMGVLAAPAGSDEGQAGGGQGAKPANSSSSIKADGGSEVKGRSAIKSSEGPAKADVHARKDSSSERTSFSSKSKSVRSSSGSDVRIKGSRRHYVSSEPDTALIYKRKHRRHGTIYSYDEPSVTIRSKQRRVYGYREKAGDTYVSGRKRSGASVYARTETSVRGSEHKQRGSASLKTESRGQGKIEKSETNAAAGANVKASEKSSERARSGGAQAGPAKQEGSGQGG